MLCRQRTAHSTNRFAINTLALAARRPTMHGSQEQVEAGGLISYAANFPDRRWRARTRWRPWTRQGAISEKLGRLKTWAQLKEIE